mgnify:CR=1 FL=1
MEDNNKDFWDELSEERKENIDKALKEVQEGKTIPHALGTIGIAGQSAPCYCA